MRRLLLIRHAATAAVRAAAFGADEPLDDGGIAAATALAASLPRADAEAYASPALRARQTAAAAGIEHPELVAALAECDFGRWAGQTLADVHRAEPEATAAWMTDPGAAPHGGESLTVFLERVRGWIDAQAQRSGTGVAITHGGVVKAAVVHVLGAPAQAFWRIDVAPASVTELRAHAGRWTLTRTNAVVA